MANECQTLEELWTWCLKEHYLKNDHHPEHFQDPDHDMPDLARIELTCDLLACAMAKYEKHHIPITLSQCRSLIETEQWPHWKFAMTDALPAATLPLPHVTEHVTRWKRFPTSEKLSLTWYFKLLKRGMTFPLDKLMTLPCVQYYLEDLKLHKQLIATVCKQIPEWIPKMETRIHRHDQDKLDPMMILGYTAKWCFYDEELDNLKKTKDLLEARVNILQFQVLSNRYNSRLSFILNQKDEFHLNNCVWSNHLTQAGPDTCHCYLALRSPKEYLKRQMQQPRQSYIGYREESLPQHENQDVPFVVESNSQFYKNRVQDRKNCTKWLEDYTKRLNPVNFKIQARKSDKWHEVDAVYNTYSREWHLTNCKRCVYPIGKPDTCHCQLAMEQPANYLLNLEDWMLFV